jgi:hypothetical protein
MARFRNLRVVCELNTVICGSILAMMLAAPLKRKTWAFVVSGVATFAWGGLGFLFMAASA